MDKQTSSSNNLKMTASATTGELESWFRERMHCVNPASTVNDVIVQSGYLGRLSAPKHEAMASPRSAPALWQRFIVLMTSLCNASCSHDDWKPVEQRTTRNEIQFQQ